MNNNPYTYCLKLSGRLLLKGYIRRRSWKVLFFGSDDFSMYSLKALHKLQGTSIAALDIATTLATPQNKVYKFATEENLKIYPWPPTLPELAAYHFGVVVSFGHLIPKKIIDYFPMGMLNVHASMLPRWRGASPIIHSLLHGDKETGISIMRIRPHHFDTGNVILQKTCAIHPEERLPSLHSRLGDLGASCLIEAITTLPECLVRSVPQDENFVTYAPRISSNLANVQWSSQTAYQVYNLFRALFSRYVLETQWHGSKVKLKEIKLLDDSENFSETPGKVIWDKTSKLLKTQCKHGAISIEKLTISGKTLKPVDFFTGYLSKRPKDQWLFS